MDGYQLGRGLLELGSAYATSVNLVAEFYEACRDAPSDLGAVIQLAVLGEDFQAVYLAAQDCGSGLRLGLGGLVGRRFSARDDLQLTLLRPARKDETRPRPFPNWLRQRVEAVIWTPKNQLGLERHGGCKPAGLRARIIQRLLALNAVIWFNWLIGTPVKRS